MSGAGLTKAELLDRFDHKVCVNDTDDALALLEQIEAKGGVPWEARYAPDSKRYHPLVWVVHNDNLKMLAGLVAAKVDLNAIMSPHGDKALCDAIRHCRTALCDELLKHGADPNATGVCGNPPLDIAVESHEHYMVASLLKAGAVIDNAERTLNTWLKRSHEALQTLDALQEGGFNPPANYKRLVRDNAAETIFHIRGIFPQLRTSRGHGR